MDFIAWCSLVLEKLIEATHTSPDARSIGVDQYQLARTMFGSEITQQPEFHHSKQHEGMFDALRELERVYLVESSSLYEN